MPAPGHIALVAGLVSSSYFTFGNIGLAFCGIMPATARGQTTLPVANRVTLWEFFYETGKVGCSLLGAEGSPDTQLQRCTCLARASCLLLRSPCPPT
ncbi:hypothetical protein B0H19DRAFT_1164398 [Mycena capillaripes]|nr:hypothetical protein B0H19DRAFT_1164398 [Mycena capillaripes]